MASLMNIFLKSTDECMQSTMPSNLNQNSHLGPAPMPEIKKFDRNSMAPRPGVLRRRPRSSQDLVVGVPPIALGGIAAAGILAAAAYALTKKTDQR